MSGGVREGRLPGEAPAPADGVAPGALRELVREVLRDVPYQFAQRVSGHAIRRRLPGGPAPPDPPAHGGSPSRLVTVSAAWRTSSSSPDR